MVIVLVMFLAAILFALQRALYSLWWNRGVSVKLQFEKEMICAGGQIKLLETVENRKWLPLSSLKVKFQCSKYLEFSDSQNGNVTDKYYRNDLFAVMPYRRITRTHLLTCPQRGYYGIEGVNLVGVDLFFSEEMMADLQSSAALYVIPKALDVKEIEPAIRKLNGEISARRYELKDPFTFRGIREYAPYDEMKQISWTVTAKTDELKVKEWEHTTASSVRIFMNLEDHSILRRRELLEQSISICAGLAAELLRWGIRINIYANVPDCVTRQLLSLEDLTYLACMDTVAKSLARLDTEEGTMKCSQWLSDKLYKGSSFYTVFISPDQHEDFVEEMKRYESEAGDGFLWICPVKADSDKKAGRKLFGEKIIFVEEPS